jgi:RNase H-fold protein (predicted Holliday junction resolvase)
MPTPPEPVTGPLLAIDPGRGKCGLAVLTAEGRVLYQAVVPAGEIGAAAAAAIAAHGVTRLLLGDRTAGADVRERLKTSRVSLPLTLVDEHRSSEEGRRRYFQENRRKGWRRLLPLGLQTPPAPYDDYVAIILAERYLRAQSPTPSSG